MREWSRQSLGKDRRREMALHQKRKETNIETLTAPSLDRTAADMLKVVESRGL